MMELAGETGEACNAAKKIARLQRGMAGGSDESDNLAEELADVVICADLAAIRAGIDLGAAIVAKFNKTSEKHGFPERLYSGRVRLANICNCDLHCRRWNPDSGRCENCGRRIEAGA
jgi:NTP pyrophosphatase (non-canonical NTP hydrolase)